MFLRYLIYKLLFQKECKTMFPFALSKLLVSSNFCLFPHPLPKNNAKEKSGNKFHKSLF